MLSSVNFSSHLYRSIYGKHDLVIFSLFLPLVFLTLLRITGKQYIFTHSFAILLLLQFRLLRQVLQSPRHYKIVLHTILQAKGPFIGLHISAAVKMFELQTLRSRYVMLVVRFYPSTFINLYKRRHVR